MDENLRFFLDGERFQWGDEKFPDFVSITILSYDPFDIGDMYYEARTVLSTHSGFEYKDGITHIFLYCKGKVNAGLSPAHGKRLMEVLKYIVSGEIPDTLNPEVNNLETIVSKIKKRPEVTKKYMQQWDRERILVNETREAVTKEVTEQVTKEVTEQDAINVISFGRENGVPDVKIRQHLEERFKLTPDVIDELFEKVDAHQKDDD